MRVEELGITWTFLLLIAFLSSPWLDMKASAAEAIGTAGSRRVITHKDVKDIKPITAEEISKRRSREEIRRLVDEMVRDFGLPQEKRSRSLNYYRKVLAEIAVPGLGLIIREPVDLPDEITDEVVSALESRLVQGDEQLKYYAADILLLLPYKDDVPLELLIEGVRKSWDPLIRTRFALALGERGDKRAIPALTEALKDEHYDDSRYMSPEALRYPVRACAKRALRFIELCNSPQPGKALLEAFEDFDDKDYNLFLWASARLAELGMAEEALPVLKRVRAEAKSSKPGANLLFDIAVGRLSSPIRLRKDLDSEDPAVFRSALVSIYSHLYGMKEFIPRLQAMYQEEKDAARRELLKRTLKGLGVRNP